MALNLERFYGFHEKIPTLPTFLIEKAHPPSSFTSHHCCCPFHKWGIDVMHCKPILTEGHGYIIVVMEYFTKWVEAMPTHAEDGKIVALFLFNHIIVTFIVLQAIVANHGSHFQNQKCRN